MSLFWQGALICLVGMIAGFVFGKRYFEIQMQNDMVAMGKLVGTYCEHGEMQPHSYMNGNMICPGPKKRGESCST